MAGGSALLHSTATRICSTAPRICSTAPYCAQHGRSVIDLRSPRNHDVAAFPVKIQAVWGESAQSRTPDLIDAGHRPAKGDPKRRIPF